MSNHNDELKHYGVKGMKWGVRRGNSAKAYAKASRKLEKLDRRVEKTEKTMNKRIEKADKSMASRGWLPGSNKRRTKRHNDARASVADYKNKVRKAKRWYDAMNSTFRNTPYSLSSEQIAMGKKYSEALVMDSLIRYN